MRFTQTSTILGSILAVCACSAPAQKDDTAGKTNGVMFQTDDNTGQTTVNFTTTMASSSSSGAQPTVNIAAGNSNDGQLLTGDSESGGIAGDTVNADNPDNVVDCGAADQPTSLKGVVLAFVFDVSASMGSHLQPYFDRDLKWDPVVAATKAFFSDPASAGISATLTFFPNDQAELQGGPADNTATMDPAAGGAGAGGATGFPMQGGGFQPGGFQTGGPMCDATEYATPDVGLTALPSDAFGAAIDAVTPADDASWRVGTPTLPAIQGTIDAINMMAAQDPNTQYSIVLVTDGMPALCGGNTDNVSSVASAVAAVADTIPTYVIGVENPATDADPNPPDSVSDLNAVSQAGGTGDAFLINTDDPAMTTSELQAIIEQIRENSFTCTVPIPEPPPGDSFDPMLVNVVFNDGTQDVPYYYDPQCAGDSGWFFDDANNPTSIQICPNVCDTLRNNDDTFSGQLKVQFGCQRVPAPPTMK